MYKIKSLLIIFALSIVVSACNSGSISLEPRHPLPQFFDRTDGGGARRFSIEGRIYHILTTNIDDPIVDPTQSVNTEALPEISSLPLSRRYEGTLTRRRITGFEDARFHMYTDKDWPRVYALLATDSDRYTDFEVGGPRVPGYLNGPIADLPSGEHIYTGTTIITPRHGGEFIYTGELHLVADFDNSDGYIRATVNDRGGDGQGDDFYSQLTGEFSIDYRDGSFEGYDLRLVVNDGPNELRLDSHAFIYGNFHEARGQAVTGIFYDDSASPAYGGAIIGARTRY